MREVCSGIKEDDKEKLFTSTHFNEAVSKGESTMTRT